jgi:predicted RNA-binding protein with TRAM domain
MVDNAPVYVGQNIKVKINAIAPNGLGIAHHEGFTIYVDGVDSETSNATVKITKIARTYADARRVQ